MIIRKFKWVALQLLFLSIIIIEAQHSRSYDTGDWIPIDPLQNDNLDVSASEPIVEQKKATGRVLNLANSPNKHFFPEDGDFVRKRPTQQFLRETVYPKTAPRTHKQKIEEHPYKFENIRPIRGPQAPNLRPIAQSSQESYELNTKFVAPPPPLPKPQYLVAPPPQPNLIYQQPPNNQQYFPTNPALNSQFVVPSQTNPGLFELNPNQNFLQYNRTLFDTLTGGVNQELLGAIQNQPQILQPQSLLQNQQILQNQPLNLNQQILQTQTALRQNQQQQQVKTKPQKVQEDNKDTVQLVYVPLENLKNQPFTQESEAILRQTELPRQEKQFLTRPNAQPQTLNYNLQQNIEQDFIRQAIEAQRLQEQLQLGQPILYQQPQPIITTTTTTAPILKKRKPHQPPLAVYMEGNEKLDVKDVINVLKTAKTISVQDSVGKNSPQVFVGPSNLNPPDGYAKFPLPYLSSIDNNRIERKIDQLPFFVAPLSYKAPAGYSKIPLPSPHVGSVVVSTKEELVPPTTSTTLRTILANQNYINPFQQVLREPSTLSASSLHVTPKTIQQNQISQFDESSFDKSQINKFINSGEQIQQLPSFTESPKTVNQINKLNQQQELLNNAQFNSPQEIINKGKIYPNSQEEIKDQYVRPQPVKYSQEIPNFDFPSTPELNRFIYNSEAPQNTVRSAPKPQSSRFSEQENSRPQQLPLQQFELAQINNQFNVEQQSQGLNTDSYRFIPTDSPQQIPSHLYSSNYDETSTTPASEKVRTRHRKTTTQKPILTTQIPAEKDKYTVLEEFNARQQPETTTVKYLTQQPIGQSQYLPEIDQIKANVYKLTPQQPQSVYAGQSESIHQHVLNQEMMDQQILQGLRSASVNAPSQTSQFERQHVTTAPQIEPLVHNRGQQSQENYNIGQIQQENYNRDQSYQVQLPENYNIRQQNIYQQSTPPASRVNENYNISPQLPQISPILPGLINNLQDESLDPNLVTTTEQITKSTQITPDIPSSSEISSTEAQPIETTTPFKRTRGRTRGSSRFTTVATTRRTAVNRRRPVTRPTSTTTERLILENYSSTDYTPVVNYNNRQQETENTRKSVNTSRQRFRTRGRPTQTENSITERSSQVTEPAKPVLESGFQGTNGEPQSYMQFDHVINNQEIITIKNSPEDETQPQTNIKEYHQVYSLSPQVSSTETPTAIQETVENKPVVDIKITHPINENHASEEPLIISQPDGTTEYVRFNANVQSGGVLYNNKHNEGTTTTRPAIRIRGRNRIRPRPTSVTTTTRPSSRYTTTTEEQRESYGFIRTPNYDKPRIQDSHYQSTNEEPSPTYSDTIQTTPRQSVQYTSQSNSDYNNGQSFSETPIQFVGEIRPKYQKTISTTPESVQPETEAPKVRTRGRLRLPSRKSTTEVPTTRNRYNSQRQSLNEVHSTEEHTTRRTNNLRGRTRGKSHFKLPETQNRPKTDDEDVEGGNYPGNYKVRGNRESETSTKSSAFQITVEPNFAIEEDDNNNNNDQLPYSSIYRPRFVPNPEGNKWTEASNNNLEFEEKKLIVDTASTEASDSNLDFEDKKLIVDTASTERLTEVQTEVVATSTELPFALPIVLEKKNEETQPEKLINDEDKDFVQDILTEIGEDSTEEIPTTTDLVTSTTKRGRRRGVWKLRRHRPIEKFETAESQNYQSVLNSFEQTDKDQDKHNWSGKLENPETLENHNKNNLSEDYNNNSNNNNEKNTPITEVVKSEEPTTILPTTSTTPSGFFDSIYDMFGISNKEEAEGQENLEEENPTTVLYNEIKEKETVTTTTPVPIFPNEYLQETTTEEKLPERNSTESDSEKQNFTTEVPILPTTLKTLPDVRHGILPWEMRVVKTSTSTEVSHETEICYKGRCVKSTDKKRKLL